MMRAFFNMPFESNQRCQRLGQLFLFTAFAGCMVAAAAIPASADEGAHKSGKSHARIPTPPGISIHLVSPQNGASFENGKPIRIEVRTDGLNASGYHWHLYLDGELEAMVGGGRTTYDLSSAEPGEHELEVTISNDSHKEYDQTDKVKITVSAQKSGEAGGSTPKGAVGAH